MLTRIRNANSAKHDTVKVPASNMKKAIAQILVDEGYIKGFKVFKILYTRKIRDGIVRNVEILKRVHLLCSGKIL